MNSVTYAIQYEIRRAPVNDELVESGELVLQGEDILDVVLQAEDALLDPQEREGQGRLSKEILTLTSFPGYARVPGQPPTTRRYHHGCRTGT